MPLVANSTSLHKTFMDTLGRTTLSLTALNVIDDSRDTHLIVRIPLDTLRFCLVFSPLRPHWWRLSLVWVAMLTRIR